ncbi:MAG: hypothetical protein GC159_05110 [Phycisphaera sp.]|nr:hypothetical protein [Phycisphaera sp.]
MFTQLMVVIMVLGGVALEVYSYWYYYTYRDRNQNLTIAVFLSTQAIAFVGIGGGVLLFNASRAAPVTSGPVVVRDRRPVTPPTRPTDADLHDFARDAVLEHLFTAAPPRFADSFHVETWNELLNTYDVSGTFTVASFTGEQTQRFSVRLSFTHDGAFRKTDRVSVNDEVLFANE